MRRLLICVLLGIVTTALLLIAQNQSTALANLSELSRRGELPQLIQSANSLLTNAKLAPTEQGIVFTYLGHAYQQSGDFTRATAYYERALAIIDRDGQHPAEYATILGTLATIYAEMGQTDTAKHVLVRSVRLFEKDGDHAQIAMIWNDLATIAADEHASRVRPIKCIARSLGESQRAPNINSLTKPLLSPPQRRASPNSTAIHRRTAIADYQHSSSLFGSNRMKTSIPRQHGFTCF